MKKSKKAIIFFHVPKCAGTWFWTACVRASAEHFSGGDCRQIDVMSKDDGARKLRLLAQGMGEFYQEKKNITLSEGDLEEFLTNQNTKLISAANIEPTANFSSVTKLVNDLVLQYGGLTPALTLLMRHPLERVQSLFYYLRDVGAWEPTAGKIQSNSFEEYVFSGQCESNWLVRRLCSLTDDDLVNVSAFKKAKVVLQKFDLIGATEQMSTFLKEAKERYNIEANPGRQPYFSSKEVENRNLISQKEKISKAAMERFTELNCYDLALYREFCFKEK